MAEIDKSLTFKQRRFAQKFVGEAAGNATRAAQMAGYHCSSEESLRQVGSHLLAHPKVAGVIMEMTEENACTAAEILHELALVAFMPLGSDGCIEVTTRHGEIIRVRADVASKVKALELLGKYHQLFAEKINIEVVQKALVGVDLDRI